MAAGLHSFVADRPFELRAVGPAALVWHIERESEVLSYTAPDGVAGSANWARRIIRLSCRVP
jgi:hypothetical protein